MNYENRPDKVRTIMVFLLRCTIDSTSAAVMAHGLLTFSSFAPQFLSSCPFARLV
ncbi:hypothetical protein PILCRDRAFT_822909, partial [Piloderma croceum F 1598]